MSGTGHSEKWAKTLLSTMDTPAWRALSLQAQALYPWLKFEWKGPKANNNGKISLSTRYAAEKIGISQRSAVHAFWELQAKGFLVQTKPASLGGFGNAQCPAYELTELAMPGKRVVREMSDDDEDNFMKFKFWRPGHDFPVKKALAHNPSGRNGQDKDGKVVPFAWDSNA